MRSITLTPLLSLTLAAQTTHIVDALGGSGVFQTLPAAVQAANHGDVILVLPTGIYDFNLTTDKGLTIVGTGPGPTIYYGRLIVAGLPLNRQFAMSRFASQLAPQVGGLGITQCAGQVVLENLALVGVPSALDQSGRGLYVINSAQVTIHNSTCTGVWGAYVQYAHLAASDSTFQSPPPGIGLVARGGFLHLTRCQVTGAVGMWLSSSSGPSAMSHAVMAGGSASGTTLPGAMLDPGCSLRLDSAAAVTGPLYGTVMAYESGRASLTLAAPGQIGGAGFDGPAGTFGVLALALPAYVSPTPFGDLWCDAQNHVVVAFGTVPLLVPITIPVAASPGQVLVAQGMLLHQNAFRLSGPIHALVP